MFNRSQIYQEHTHPRGWPPGSGDIGFGNYYCIPGYSWNWNGSGGYWFDVDGTITPIGNPTINFEDVIIRP